MPDRYRVIVVHVALKALRKLPVDLRRRLQDALRKIGAHPRPPGAEKMKGKDRYRYRVGQWRIVYDIQDDVLVVLVLTIAARGRAYKKR